MERYEKEYVISLLVLSVILGLIAFIGINRMRGPGGTEDVETHNDAGTGRDAGDNREGAIHLEDTGEINVPGELGGSDNVDFYSFDGENGQEMEFQISPGGGFAGQLSASLLPPGGDSPVASTGAIGGEEGGGFVHTAETSGTYALKIEGEGFKGSYVFKIGTEG